MNDQSTQAEEEATGPIGGERLRAARRKIDISVRDIAKELHLDEPKVRALEDNKFDVLGAPVFAKGHLRKYAELVGVPVDDILSDYYQLNRSAGAPPIVGPKRARPQRFFAGPWVIGTLLGIAIAAVTYWWFTSEITATPPLAIAPATQAPVAPEPRDSMIAEEDPVPESDEMAADPLTDNGNDTTQAASAPLITEPILQDEGTSLLPQVNIELTYSGDCWTEVSDASGRRLFYDLGTAGRVVSIGGDAPLRLVLGDRNNVSITVEGRDYPMPNSPRGARLARLTINRP